MRWAAIPESAKPFPPPFPRRGRPFPAVALAVAALAASAGGGHAQALPHASHVWVKFAEGAPIRLRQGKPDDLAGDRLRAMDPLLDELAAEGFTWERPFPDISEEQLEALHRTAEARLGKSVADQNLEFLLRIPEVADAAALIHRLSDRPEVEWVEAAKPPPPLPLPPDYTLQQGYAASPPGGIGAEMVRGLPGGDGQWATVADIEYSWNFAHLDLPANISLIGPNPVDPFDSPNHGTAVLGEVVSVNNAFGTTGLAPAAQARVVAANTTAGWNVAAALNRATLALQAGDVILIEQQMWGPRSDPNDPTDQFGLVPVEWDLASYNAIVTAVGNGIVVVEAGCNGQQNLDDPIYNAGHAPFLLENDSGAIIVGAGEWSGGQARRRLWYSNFGRTLDLQGWGNRIYTTGYGDLYNAEGPNLDYTRTFGGTSGASPIVASAVCIMQSMAKAATGSVFTPAQVRDILRATGTPQTGNTAENIGPLPDLPAAVAAAFSTPFDPPGSFSLLTPPDASVGVARPVILSWEPAPEAATYRLVMDDDPGFASPILTRDYLASHSYTIPANLTPPLTTYYWSVEARNIGGTTPASPPLASFTTAGDPPGSFAILAPPDGAVVATRTPILAWQPSAGASAYSVAISTLPNLASPILAQTGLTATSLQTPSGLLADHVRYYWGVRAANAWGESLSQPTVASFAVELPYCLGDADGDRLIAFSDLTMVLGQWGRTGPLGDANGDHRVDAVDLSAVLTAWQNVCP